MMSTNTRFEGDFVEAAAPTQIHGAHVISLTGLSKNGPNEDRYSVEKWLMPNGSWTFAAVFDGHGGTAAVDFVVSTLPNIIKSSLSNMLAASPEQAVNGSAVARMLSDSITLIDSAIAEDFKAILPSIFLPSQEISAAPKTPDGANLRVEALRALSGTTCTIALVDPMKGVHLASLGDCDAYICRQTGNAWNSDRFNPEHNTKNVAEFERVKGEHPNEPNCLDNGPSIYFRVLGSLMLTRALGNMLFKLDAHYFENLQQAEEIDTFVLGKSITPPYISNTADTYYIPPPAVEENRFLILSSDGLIDLFRLCNPSVRLTGEDFGELITAAKSENDNMALKLLWTAFGGDGDSNRYVAAREKKLQGGRVDDITAIVLPL